MGQENPRISFGQNVRESGLTSCGDEWVVPKSLHCYQVGSRRWWPNFGRKTTCLTLGENDPQPIEDNCDFILEKKLQKVNFNAHSFSSEIWIFSQQCSAWFFFFFFPAGNLWRWNNGGGAMEEEVERERERRRFRM